MLHRYDFQRVVSSLTGLLLLLACEAPPEATSSPLSTDTFTVAQAMTPGTIATGFKEGPLTADMAAACPDDRWVGYWVPSTTPICPTTASTPGVGTWTTSKLFPGATGAPGVPADLDRFCVYAWTPALGYTGPPDTSLLPDIAALRLERDCHVVVPLFTPGPSAPIFEHAIEKQMTLPDFPEGFHIPSPGRVHVAVIDSSPTEHLSGLPSYGGDGHGFVVGALVRKLSCVRTSGQISECGTVIKNYEALPLGDGLTSYGRPSQVGVAMYEAMRDWQPDAENTRLILTLALGWAERYSGAFGPSMRVTAFAPWKVAQWAACEGALLIAAAGNRAHVAGDTGPMFPAGWERDARECPYQGPAYGPLVHGVGAVDGRDLRLRIMRADAMPRLAAPGAFATSSSMGADGIARQSALLSGTSISVATTAATAALAWSLDPLLTAEAIMAAIYDGGVNTSMASEVWSGPTRWSVRRVDMCAAVQAVCLPGTCPLACKIRPYGRTAVPNFPASIDAEHPGLLDGPITPGVTVKRWATVPAGPEAPVVPFAGPQPGVPICAQCQVNQLHFIGQFDIEEDTQIDHVFLRPDVCSPDWCDPELGGIFLDIPQPWLPFKIDIEAMLDVSQVNSAMLEVLTTIDGVSMLRSSEIFVAP
ncbi:MAG: S8/S53 family peptidase [Myxococcota bacterium]